MEGLQAGLHARRRSRRWARRFVWLAVVLVVAYGGVIGYLIVNERSLIFRPRRTAALVAASLRLDPVEVALTTARGDRTIAWQMRAATPSPYWVLYLHGNDATIRSGGNVQRYDQFRSLGVNVMAPEYPGYLSVDGEPSEERLRGAARAAYDYLRDLAVPAERIVIFGWSLGSGGAIPLARDVDEAALIVEGAFTSVLRRAQAQYPFLPISLMVHHPFLSEDAIADTRSPTLFLHSPEDSVIPFSDGERLHAKAKVPKRLVRVRGGHVTPNLDDEDTYLGAIHAFLTAQVRWTLRPPRRSVGLAVRTTLERDGVDAALAAYARFRQEGEATWNLAEYELERVGRVLLEQERYEAALAILALNARTFGDSPLAQFHLGVAEREAGHAAAARAAFVRSLTLDSSPANTSHAALASLE